VQQKLPAQGIKKCMKCMNGGLANTDSPETSIFISLKSESSRSCAEFMLNNSNVKNLQKYGTDLSKRI
jgi:hypothetical protein